MRALTVRLGDEENDEEEHDERPDEEDVVRPAPVGVVVDEATDSWTDGWSREGGEGVQQHGRLKVLPSEEIAHCAAGHGKEGTPRQAIEETGDNHGGDVLGDGLRDDPDKIQGPRDEVDGAAAVELAEGPEKHGTQADAQDECREAQRRDDARGVKLGVHLGVSGGIDGRSGGAGSGQSTKSRASLPWHLHAETGP